MRYVPMFAVLLCSVAVTGCGEGSTAAEESAAASASQENGGKAKPGKAAALDPCGYITAEEVAAITGDPVSRASSSKDTCKYHAEPDDGAEIEVHLEDGVKKMEVAKKTVEFLGGIGKEVGKSSDTGAAGDTEKLLTASKSDAPPIGDEAAWGLNSMLSVRKGTFYAEITPPLMHDPAVKQGIPLIPAKERREIATKIATQVVARATAQGY